MRISLLIISCFVTVLVSAQRTSLFGEQGERRLAISVVPTEWLKSSFRTDITYNLIHKYGIDLSLFNQGYTKTTYETNADEPTSRDDLTGLGFELKGRLYFNESGDSRRFYTAIGYTYRYTRYQYLIDAFIPIVQDGLTIYIPGKIESETFFIQHGATAYGGVELGKSPFLTDVYVGLGYRWSETKEGESYNGNAYSSKMRHPGYEGVVFVVGVKLGIYVL